MAHPADAASGELDWQDGQPVSRRFGDVFFSRGSGVGETHHVFLAGNALRERWAGLVPGAQFLVGETGFGTGLNFLCAWALWDEAAPRDARFHFVSVEAYPLRREELARALALWPALGTYREQLVHRWEDFAPGWHRLAFAPGRVTLTLLIGDVGAVLPRLDADVDAWFLDGFAPARNPEMWSPAVLAQVARLSRPGTTFATYTCAGDVRRGLEGVGFTVRKEKGFGAKREMFCGTLATRPAGPWRAPWFTRPDTPRAERRAVIIGSGPGGASTAASLAARGWAVEVLERRGDAGPPAAGKHQGILYAHPSPHPTALNELALAGLQHSARLLRGGLVPDPDDHGLCGVLQLAYDDAESRRQAGVAALGVPRALLHPVDRAGAAAIAGLAMPHGGLFFPSAGWVHPPALCRALLDHARIRVHRSRTAIEIVRTGPQWTVHDAAGLAVTAPTLVIAAGAESGRFGATRHVPLRAIRGQITLMPATPASRALRTVLCGEGYVAPARNGVHSLGATHKFRDLEVDVRATENQENVQRLGRLAPALHAALDAANLDAAALEGVAGLRCSSPDYLPVIGPVANAAAFTQAYAALSRDAMLEPDVPSPWLDGLYLNTAHGSRGLVTAPLSGEVLAAYLEGEPMPLPTGVVEALHPSRFLLRALIRHRIAVPLPR
ncbi:MAG TPA: bifunctional tRNA (5-methylaminomethyl-2-thiouridine)(34)-methyltransferase MnmD/FAD-dependent 5-carboxymethylaminomethyl-2-thiouridine(34) oxidoreductase MnmC [Burkholderiales bacterium]|nr:bifunctional tRNA (5-methylaminomethyl-2-thiouridine)(34)-methyltransferase MnmD/FAD-dependent 5-carboxymethylaminomethyl-2-thiouridine(34) oxidoreductase MnmC [Burkholderiales bacterium]